MAYKALYRTYRPQKFSEVIGQDHIVRTLQNALASGKISHAYLFSGPRGTGKTSVARIFAKALNCNDAPTNEPCGKCTSCQEIADSNNPDVVEIDAASNNGVDEIREIRDKVKFLPGGSKYKIYIIDEVHMLSQGAFNALLKTLEEPPKHVIFILATTEPHKVIPTIISRCQRYDFKTLSVIEIADVIKKVAKAEEFTISEEAIIGISEGAEGGMRDALSYLDQAASFTDDVITIDDVNNVTGNLNYDKIIELAGYFETKNINKALKTVNDLIMMGKEINKIVSGMLQFYRDILLYKNIDTSMFSKYIFEKEDFKKLVIEIEANKIFYYVDILSEVQTKIKTTSTPNIYLEVAVIKIINVADEDLNYMKRIKELEEKINNFSPKQIGEDSSPIDNEKIISMENKLARVINELSKLELHKLTERVGKLEENPSEKLKIDNLDLTEIDDRITLLKNNINNLQYQINDIKESIQAKKLDSEDQTSLNADNLDTQFINKLTLIENELEEIKSKRVNLINGDSNSNLAYDIDQIKDKIANIESKVYKLMSGALADNSPTLSKKPKRKVNEKQIVLFGDEIVALSDLEKPMKEKFDFNENQKITTQLQKEDIAENEVETYDDNQEVELIKPVDDQSVNEDLDLPNNLFTVSDLVQKDDKPQEEPTLENEVLNVITVSDLESDPKKEDKKKQLKSQLVINNNQKQESIDLFNVNNQQEISNISPKPLEPVKVTPLAEQSYKPKPLADQTYKVTPNVTGPENDFEGLFNEEYNNYSVSIIERILHNSRTELAREDKIRIANLWKVLDNTAPREKLDIADLLQEGQVVAVGEKEFILVYPNATLCNQVMKIKFKREALKLLSNALGENYNYIALPDNVWTEKRIEYINQYNIGVRLPKLTPINDPNLSVEKENFEYISSQEKMVNKAYKLFGENIVKIE